MSVAWPEICRFGWRQRDSGAGDFAWCSGDGGFICHRPGWYGCSSCSMVPGWVAMLDSGVFLVWAEESQNKLRMT